MIYPPLKFNDLPGLTTNEFLTLQRVYLLASILAEALLFWDWASHLPTEIDLIWKSEKKGAFGWAFLCSRYLALAWGIVVGVVWLSVAWNPLVCSATRYFPQGYSVVLLSAHVCIIIRVWSLWKNSKKLLAGLLCMAGACFCGEVVANLYVQPNLVTSQAVGAAGGLELRVCFLSPTSIVFALSCLLPSIVGHILLLFTLIKTVAHIRAQQSTVVKTLQADQILFVLLICLANFANLVLVLQTKHFNYKLLNFLPSMVLTQVLLARIVFNLKRISNDLTVQQLGIGDHQIDFRQVDHMPKTSPRSINTVPFFRLPAYRSKTSSKASSDLGSPPLDLPLEFQQSQAARESLTVRRRATLVRNSTYEPPTTPTKGHTSAHDLPATPKLFWDSTSEVDARSRQPSNSQTVIFEDVEALPNRELDIRHSGPLRQPSPIELDEIRFSTVGRAV